MFHKSARSAEVVGVTVKSTQSVALSERNSTSTVDLRRAVEAKGAIPDVYPVADFVGRCFLRVCCWFDVCTSWVRQYGPPLFTARVDVPSVRVTVPPAVRDRPAIPISRRTKS